MAALPRFEEFASSARALGYQDVLARRWQPGQVVADHSHPFDAWALVVQGEMWLTVDGVTRHLTAGDRFELERDKPHSERYGDDGATYWVGRRAR